MKTLLHVVFILLCFTARSQITTPVIRANFGVDGDLRSNYFNGFNQNGNDDWFSNSVGTGAFVIDTTGAGSMVARYLVDPNFRKLPFYRTMRYPQYSIINNRLLIDAVYIRDYNGQAGGDSTAFVTSNKNGDSPQVWGGGVTSVLDKNDIAEMMIHVRREGPNKYDSLWFFGGLSLQGTNGNRYFDFELYQTDIFYSRSTGRFSNYGPDAGHTSWTLDPLTGRILTPGDVIFTAEYSSSSLTFIEARIWVDRATTTITPRDFDWSGSFDGAGTGSQFGYASIRPKNGGTYYTGLQSGNGTWAGPFGFIDGGNNYVTTYSARQFMEFSVNLTKLGLDPITLLSGGACGLPFRRILVKTRSSTSFSSELKDFIGPFDFFTAAPVQAQADVPIFCGAIGVSTISVTNALPASVYTWSTPDGHIVTSTNGTSITVDAPGTYIVQQQLLDGCGSYAADTVVVKYDSTCWVLSNNVIGFKGSLANRKALLNWTSVNNTNLSSFILERSANGFDFEPVADFSNITEQSPRNYSFTDNLATYTSRYAYYRLKVTNTSGLYQYTQTVRLELEQKEGFTLSPNPARDYLHMSLNVCKDQEIKWTIVGAAGQVLRSGKVAVKAGNNSIIIDAVSQLPPGTYMMAVASDKGMEWKKFIVSQAVKF